MLYQALISLNLWTSQPFYTVPSHAIIDTCIWNNTLGITRISNRIERLPGPTSFLQQVCWIWLQCQDTWGTFWARTAQVITATTAWKTEEWSNKAGHTLSGINKISIGAALAAGLGIMTRKWRVKWAFLSLWELRCWLELKCCGQLTSG